MARAPWALVLLVLALGACTAPPEPPVNVLLITVDTLRADRLGYAGREREVSPALDRLAAEGVRFERCYSQAGWTLPSVATILTGLYPAQHGAVRAAFRMNPEATSLATRLSKAGYQTSGLVSHGFLGESYGFEQGFEHYDASVLEVGNPQHIATATPLTEMGLAELERLKPPFFLWLHYFDPHYEYLSYPEWAHFGTKRADRYDAEIAQTDRQIGRLLGALDELNLSDSTIVVFTADHGEEFGDHGGMFHFSLFEEDVRIPLVIRAPGIEPRVERAVAEQIDIVPTILHLAGLPPVESLPGRVLLPPSGRDRPVFIERERPRPFLQQAVIRGDFKIYRVVLTDETVDVANRIEKTAVLPGIRIYDLASDPAEKRNLYREGDPASVELLELLDSLADVPHQEGTYVGVDDETRQKLLSLGYVD